MSVRLACCCLKKERATLVCASRKSKFGKIRITKFNIPKPFVNLIKKRLKFNVPFAQTHLFPSTMITCRREQEFEKSKFLRFFRAANYPKIATRVLPTGIPRRIFRRTVSIAGASETRDLRREPRRRNS